jgi:hypothetical protein
LAILGNNDALNQDKLIQNKQNLDKISFNRMNQSRLDVRSLLAVYDKSRILEVKKLEFEGVCGLDVYNVTAPFRNFNREYIAGRVEPRENELESRVMFFMRMGNKWVLDTNAPIFNLQDPLVNIVNGEIILGGVRVIRDNEDVSYFTEFYKGNDIYNLKLFAQGPVGMKDIRFTPLSEGGLGLFTRPQGEVGGRGRIGFMKINSLESLQTLKREDYISAPLLKGNYHEEEWFGANAAYALKNGMIAVLGHIACYTEDDKKQIQKNYYPITFALHPETNEPVGMKIIAARFDFPKGESKSEMLRNVLFAGGLVRHGNGLATLYGGGGDAEGDEIKMIDPLLEYELYDWVSNSPYKS